MKIRVLGPIEVASSAGERVAVPGSKLRGLIAILSLEAGSTVTTPRLIEALWGDQPVNGPNALQVLVSKLRRSLVDAGEEVQILTQPSGYQLDARPDEIDALRFEELLAVATASHGDHLATATALGEALQLWTGAALADVPDTDMFARMRTRLEELHRIAVEDLVDAELALGYHQRLAPQLESLVAAEPLRERRWGQLMRALYGSGQQAAALRAYQRARDHLIEELGIEPSIDLRRLEAAVLAQDETLLAPPEPTSRGAPIGETFRRRGNLRHPVGACIGREEEIERLVVLVESNRLVTLTGPGGVGKTRLANELGVRVIAKTPGGVWWVELAAARDSGDVLSAVERALQLEASGGATPEEGIAEVARAIGDADTVLVLDNCEHLLSTVDPLVEELLGRCPNLRLVATSREGLAVCGELLYTVGPLSLPAAVSLFEQRIAGLVADGDVGTDVIAEICERLDRLPLGIELAAGRARHMRLGEVLERLTDRFDLLRDDARVSRPHQRDLQAVADWSYDLLDQPERIVFERLSVFSAGATLAGARAVCSDDAVTADQVEWLLDRLIDKSLVHSDRSGSETRYRMLRTLADYASNRLIARSGDDAAQRAHAIWVRDLARSVEFGARTNGPMIARIHDEDAAVRDAVGWALGADPPLALEICSMLAPFWFGTMRVSTGWELLSRALEACDADLQLRSSALAWAIVFSTMQYDLDAADRFAEEATALAHASNDPDQLGRVCFARALAAGYRRDDDASRWAPEARTNFELAGRRVALGHVSLATGAASLLGDDLDGAVEDLRAAIEVFRTEQDHLGLILAVSRLGEAAWRIGDIDLFASTHAELLDLGRSSRSSGVVTGATARLALAFLQRGDLDEAKALADRALSSSSDSFMPVVNGYAFKSAGLVNLALGHVEEGRAHLHQAIDAFERGTGRLGTGQAALCWIEVSRSHRAADEVDDTRRAATTAIDLSQASGDPWVQREARAHLELVGG